MKNIGEHALNKEKSKDTIEKIISHTCKMWKLYLEGNFLA